MYRFSAYLPDIDEQAEIDVYGFGPDEQSTAAAYCSQAMNVAEDKMQVTQVDDDLRTPEPFVVMHVVGTETKYLFLLLKCNPNRVLLHQSGVTRETLVLSLMAMLSLMMVALST